MEGKNDIRQRQRSFSRKRHLVIKGKKTFCFNLYKPLLNLSAEEYDKRLKEIKKMSNMG